MSRAPSPRRVGPAGRRTLAGDRAAVSDVMGAIMMVGITLISAVGFGLLLFSFDGPPDAYHTRVAATLVAGTGGWGTGDEQLRLTHLGGEPLDDDRVTIRVVTTAGGTVSLTGSALGSNFTDGTLTIGEAWASTMTANVGDVVEVFLIVEGERSQLLASSRIVAGASGSDPCIGDISPPTADWTQVPELDSLSSGPVSLTATLDDCRDVVDSPAPHLFYCIKVACDVNAVGDYTDGGEMSPAGTHKWSATIPHTGTWLAEGALGKSLYYYASPVQDDVPNTGKTTPEADLVDLIATYTYVDDGYAATGTIDDPTLAPAKEASANDGVLVTLEEGAVAGSAGSAGPTKFSGTTAVTGGALNKDDALTSDDARASLDTAGSTSTTLGDSIEVSGFDLPANADGVTAVTIGYEGRKANGGTDPSARIDYKLGSGSYNNGTAFTEDQEGTDIDRTRALTGSFTVSDVESMTVRVGRVSGGNKDIEVDHVFVQVTYTTSPQTTYQLEAQLNWTSVPGLPGSTVQNVELRYRTETDTFKAQVWDFTANLGAGGWRDCLGTLSSAALTSFSCPLDPLTENSGGIVRMRFTDVATSGTSPGKLHIDHARVASA